MIKDKWKQLKRETNHRIRFVVHFRKLTIFEQCIFNFILYICALHFQLKKCKFKTLLPSSILNSKFKVAFNLSWHCVNQWNSNGMTYVNLGWKILEGFGLYYMYKRFKSLFYFFLYNNDFEKMFFEDSFQNPHFCNAKGLLKHVISPCQNI